MSMLRTAVAATGAKRKLSEVASVNPTLGRPPDLDSSISFVPMAAASTEGVINGATVRRYGEVEKGYTTFLRGDILVAKITPCFENGKIVQANIEHDVGVGSTEFHVIRPLISLLHDRYLLHFLRQKWIRQEGERRMTGSAGQRRVPEAFVANLEIPLHPLPEQRRIAAILDKADALRAKRRAALDKLDGLTKALFFEMFGDPSANPKGWRSFSIGDVCEVKGGKRLPKGEEYSPFPTPYRYIRVMDLKNGNVDESALVYLKPEVQAKIARYTVLAGDIIITIAGTIGAVAPVPDSLDGVNLTENAAKIVPRRRDVYDPVFLSAMLRTPFVQDQIMSHVGQVTIGKLALFRIEKLQVPMPPLSLQREYAGRAESIEKAMSHQTASQAHLDALFASLQHRAFRGEL